MKVLYVANDGTPFEDAKDCERHESLLGQGISAYALALQSAPNGQLRRDAIRLSKALRVRVIPTEPRGVELDCADMLLELTVRIR